MPDLDQVTRWINGYLAVWNSNDPDGIRALFTDDATYQTEPYRPAWNGADEIVAGWLNKRDAPGETSFSWQLSNTAGDTVFVIGTTRYPAAVYSNLWIIELGDDGRCRRFTEWWMKHPGDD
jgi:ketosteroid isomerase-like protein